MQINQDQLKQNLSEILTVARFYVELSLNGSTEPVDAYFMECKGFKYTQSLIELAEVFPQPWGKATRGRVIRTKMPGNEKVNNINLRRGLSASTTLWNWIQNVQLGRWATQSYDGSLVIYRPHGGEGARFNFFGAWPVSYTVADSVVSGSDLAFEELELAVERFERVPTF
jgi:phage tail-like protein